MKYLMKISFISLLALTISLPSYAQNAAKKPNAFKTLSNSEDAADIIRTIYRDLDQDQVNDRIDQCLNTGLIYPVDQYGCELDSDHDGVFDALDHCPNTPLGMQVNFLGCEGDADKDKVLDSKDQCPNTPLGSKVNAVGCKYETDLDGDGVINSMDLCPKTPLGTKVNEHGCKPRDFVIIPIVFNSDSFFIRSDQINLLEKSASELKKLAGNEVILITGHTDSSGVPIANQYLSWNRAYSVKQYLMKNFNYPDHQLYVLGKDSQVPVASNATPEGRQKNRRIEFKILKASDLPADASLNLPTQKMRAYRKYHKPKVSINPVIK